MMAFKVGEGDILFQDVDVGEESLVDDETSSQAQEHRGPFGQRRRQYFLDTGKAGVERQRMAAYVCEARIIAVGLEEGHPVEVDNEQFIAGVDTYLFHIAVFK